jgi:A/G-specific adenine glycosylase
MTQRAPVAAQPENLRAYGLLMRENRILVAAEYVADVFCWKFPGGRVEDGETPEQAIVREFVEEASLAVAVGRLVHAPGTLQSPWTHRTYTPVYYLVSGGGEVRVPAHETLELRFREPEEFLASDLAAGPEKVALRAVLALT